MTMRNDPSINVILHDYYPQHNVARVKFYDRDAGTYDHEGKSYDYLVLYGKVIHPGDFVLVPANDNYAIVKVVEILSPEHKNVNVTYRWVIDVVTQKIIRSELVERTIKLTKDSLLENNTRKVAYETYKLPSDNCKAETTFDKLKQMQETLVNLMKKST